MSTNIQPLRPYTLFTDKTGVLTKTAYDFLFSMYTRIGGSLDALNAVTLADKTWEEPNPIGSTTPSTGKFTTLVVTTSVLPGGGLKHARVTTGSVGAGATALITYTWPTAFSTAAYTVVASVIDATAAVASLKVVHIETISTTQVKVRVENTSAGALTGEVQLIAMHD